MIDVHIHSGKNTKLFLGKEGDTLFKVLDLEHPSHDELLRFLNEYEITRDIQSEFVRKVIDHEIIKNKHTILFEYFPGLTLKEAIGNKPFSLIEFLESAIKCAEALHSIHEENLIHQDINPENILVNLQTMELKVIDFEFASKIDLRLLHLGNPELLRTDLRYISPEQTGRVNRSIDYRTDLYSLGVSFYELLSGRLPFEVNDPLELVHHHIAKTPPSLQERNPMVPPVVEKMVRKLMAKNAEDRYYSSQGLKLDLEKCLQQLKNKGRIDSFELGQWDFSKKLIIPEKLYGRETESAQLKDAFHRCAKGAVECNLVIGSSGTGKTELVNEIFKAVTEEKAYFISGKFNQFQKNTPYQAIIQALKEFVDLILTEDEESLISWKKIILEAVGSSGKVITDLIPSLEVVIGPQAAVPETGSLESQNRFNYVFKNFFNALPSARAPLVLFLDDLQWAGLGSFELLKSILTDQNKRYLHLIGAYRDSIVSEFHPLSTTIEELKSQGITIEEIHIGNLELNDMVSLVADTLEKRHDEVLDLAMVIHRKTQGNAFFAKQFLKSIYENGLLHRPSGIKKNSLSENYGAWMFDLEEIEKLNITENVVELLIGQINKMPEETREILKIAACIGNKFSLENLSAIRGKSYRECSIELNPALVEGIILPVGDYVPIPSYEIGFIESRNIFRFAHDNVQDAFYRLIPDKEKKYFHLKIGQLLFNNSSEEEAEALIFDLANQFLIGFDLEDSEAEKLKIAEILMRAGEKAIQSAAYPQAFEYLSSATELLGPDCWSDQYDLSIKLYNMAAESAYLVNDTDRMEKWADMVLGNAKSLMEKIKVYEVKSIGYYRSSLLESIRIGLEALELLGESFPKNPNKGHVVLSLIKTNINLIGKSPASLANQARMVDQKKIAAMRIIYRIAQPVFANIPDLFPIIILRMVDISIKYGHSRYSAFAYGSYGITQIAVLGKLQAGTEYGKLGLKIAEKFDLPNPKVDLYFMYNMFMNHWGNPLRDSEKWFQSAYQLGMENGDLDTGCWAAATRLNFLFQSGADLKRLQKEVTETTQQIKDLEQYNPYNFALALEDVILFLRGKEEGKDRFATERVFKEDNKPSQSSYDIYKMYLAYHFGEPTTALVFVQKILKNRGTILGTVNFAFAHLYMALAIMAASAYKASALSAKNRRLLKSIRKKFKKWYKFRPEVHGGKFHIIEAEINRLSGRHELVAEHYAQAIRCAKSHQMMIDEALAYELAGDYYTSRNMDMHATLFLNKAIEAYQSWGAVEKVLYIQGKYTRNEENINLPSKVKFPTYLGHNNPSDQLDLESVIKASSAISEEIQLGKLFGTLLKILMENGGGQKGVLIINRNDALLIAGHGSIENENLSVLEAIPVKGSGLVPESIINYVVRQKEALVLFDAISDAKYKRDPYIQQTKCKSILCNPIIHQGKLTGLLYLENNLTTGAFTNARIELLSYLSNQAGISIENAYLYENLEQEVSQRTVEILKSKDEIEIQKALIEQEKLKSDQLLLNILPAAVARELKETGQTRPIFFEEVSVLFADFMGFTNIVASIPGKVLVQELDEIFKEFDDITEAEGLEKIQTVGDAYLATCGLPIEDPEHATKCILAAKRIITFLEERNKTNSIKWKVRVGIHSGSITAGVIGKKKFSYDIFGDTVNIAARIESSGEPGKINLSAYTHRLVKDRFPCTYRGKINAKGKGELDMYFVK